MTVSSLTTKNSYSGNGSTSAFSYTFKIFDDDDVTVIIRTDSTGTETVKTKTTHYTVSGVGSASGGTITFTSGNIPASGETVLLLRNTPLTQATDYTPNDPFPAATHEDALDKLTLISQDTQEEIDRSIKLSRANTMTSTEFTVPAATRANKIFAFDSSGELAVTQEIGTFRGDWAASTAYAVRDLVKDTSTNNIFIVNEAHTSSGAQPLTTNANSAKYDLIVDAASATTSATNAASSATAAAASASTASTQASNASSSASTASTQASNASSSASTASTQASNAASSATAAASSATEAASSATSAASSAASLTTGISENNILQATAGVADNDFLRVDGTKVEGRSASEVLSDIGAAPAAGDSSIVTTGALNSGSITSGFGTIDTGSSAITTTGVITGGTVEATADTSAGDNAAIGFTAAEGLILTGQGSTNDVTIKNDADADVLEIPTGTTNVTVVGNMTAGGTVSGAHALSHRNLVINGAMQVAQRGTSFTSISSNTYTLDRWQLQAAGAGRSTITQSTTVPNNNFVYSTKVDVTTADTSLATTDLQSFTQRMEGNVVSQIGLGTSDAKSFTVSFWVRSNKTGTYCVSIRNVSGTRSIASEYSISSADTWEHKEVTFAGDTTGSYNTGTTEAFNVNFVLLAGTNYDGKTADTWEANTNFATDNQVNLFDNTSNEWYITGVQMELGNVATPFEHRSFHDELKRCQRYYYQLAKSGAGAEIIIAGATSGATNFSAYMPLIMRAAPSITFPTSASVRQGSGTFNVNSWQSFFHPDSTFTLNATMASSATANTASFAYSFQNDIDFDAEL